MMEFEDQEEEVPCFDSLDNSNSTWRAKMSSPVEAPTTPLRKPKYKECLKNHTVGIGGHAVDGCGEFMAAWMEGSLDALKCVACNCYHNFYHKKTERIGGNNTYYPHGHFSYKSPSGKWVPPRCSSTAVETPARLAVELRQWRMK
ncbi:Zinc-finger homeodomain protein 2 [Forsythia ovata]|uniref:Zinc-finger homeodomain protein 2 n=1 Tax=Forsythia ovata TaxID=205694 RepID=A0ABD1TR00_9LAMI